MIKLKVRQQEEAIQRMKQLKLRKEVIETFKTGGSVRLCTRPYGRFLPLTEAEKAEVKAFEQEYDAIVYFIVRAVTLFGVLDSYFFVSKDPDSWVCEREGYDKGYGYTYTFNRTNPDCSEFGDIDFAHTKNRGIIRTDIDFF